MHKLEETSECHLAKVLYLIIHCKLHVTCIGGYSEWDIYFFVYNAAT